MIDSVLKRKIAQEALRAPTVHNVQPWSLEFRGGEIGIHEDLSRTLKIGDPERHDHEVSLGALIESIDLVLKTQGFGISEILDSRPTEQTGGGRERCRLIIGTGFSPDPLAEQILRRKSYRGKFRAPTVADKAVFTEKFSGEHCAVLTDDLKAWASLYDDCAVEGNAHRPLQEELYQWLRLTKAHPGYQSDGLNREALSISSIEGWAANVLMKPSVYALLSRIGADRAVVTEAPQISSATGLLVIFRKPQASALENGRHFMRLWLALTQESFYACPLSALVDAPKGRRALEEKFPGREILNVLRVGRTAEEKLYTSPRRSPSETVLLENKVSANET